ncbi:MAG: hypothetical protein IIA61_13430 [Candidatus Marinimicrobia bacterium]|nr:hypothetical protein [Candidatus Neomarinimicrobiota bacterium]
MTYIITEPCFGVCDTAFGEVCPVDYIQITQDDCGETAMKGGFDLISRDRPIDERN